MVPPRMLLLACVAVSVSGHGYVESPPSRGFGCKSGLSSGCGQVQYEPQSVEGPDGWPSGGPADGTLAAAGRANFGQLNAQTPTRWGKTAIASGVHVFTWRFTATHVTRDFRYYITPVGWDENAPLGTASFDTTPFCVVDGGMVMPANLSSHSCTVPARSGYHVVLAVWDVGDTPASFYNAIDVTIGGAGSTKSATTATTRRKGTPSFAFRRARYVKCLIFVSLLFWLMKRSCEASVHHHIISLAMPFGSNRTLVILSLLLLMV